MSVITSFAIEYWELNEETSPVQEFIAEIRPYEAMAKVQRTVKLLADTGMSLITSPRVFKKLRQNLYELRVSWGKTAYRILVVIKKSVAYLVHAFKKQKGKESQHIKIGEKRRDIIMTTSYAN